MATAKKSVFDTLSEINVSKYVEKKGGLDYISWSYAWTLLKMKYPDSNRTVYESEHSGLNYFSDGQTCYVKVGVTINKQEIVDMLPVMDFRNRSIPVSKVTSMDVNSAIQRSTVKCIAMHGLGLSLYTGEDIPQPTMSAPKEKVLKELKVGDNNWVNILKYMGQNKDKSLEEISQMVESRYKVTAPVKKALQTESEKA